MNLLEGGAFSIVAVLLALLLFWKLWFCREPQRRVPKARDAIVSPANGTVAVVKRFDTRKAKTVGARKWNRGSVEILAEDVAKKGWFVLIVMTPLHVHYQRAPVDGKVVKTIYTPGKFHNAVKEPEKLLTLENEKNEILLETERTKGVAKSAKKGSGKSGKRRVKVVQIAGVLARRVIPYVSGGERVKKGELLGFINLGSQVALLLPDDVTVKARPGDTVTDGETIVAEWA